MEKVDQLTKLLSPRFFKALGDPNRLAILVRLATCRRPCSVRKIAECCPVDLSVVSRPLSTLRSVGILESERRGKEVFYRVRLEWLTDLFQQLAVALEEAKETCTRDCSCVFDDERRDRVLIAIQD